MSSISSASSQISPPPSINENSASNPVSGLNTQQNLSEISNAASSTSNVVSGISSDVQGIINNLVVISPTRG